MSIIENFSIERMLFSLQYMWKGMLCIFAVIAVIILFIYGINKITSRKRSDGKKD